MRIGILCGGNSNEHEISIISALDLYKRIKGAAFIYMSKNNDIYYIKKPTVNQILKKKGKRIKFKNKGFTKVKIDVVVLSLHGKNVEDGSVAALLDYYKIPYVGSKISASLIGMDKELTYLLLKQNNVCVIDKIVVRDSNYKCDEFPKIIKPARAGSSLGVEVAYDQESMEKALNNALLFDSKVIIEEYLNNFKEYSIALFYDNEYVFSKCEEIINENTIFDYDAKYKNRRKEYNHRYVLNDEIVNEIKKMAVKAYEILECDGIVRVDYLYSNGKLYINELNTIPGCLSSYAFLDFSDCIDRLVKKAMFTKYEENTLINPEILSLSMKK